MEGSVFQIMYFAPLEVYAAMCKEKEMVFERNGNFQKQSYRNRCYICGPNGKQRLNVPIAHNGSKSYSDIRISYDERWQLNHWRALKTAYKSSPYFEYFESYLYPLYHTQYDKLLDFNITCFDVINKLAGLGISYTFTNEYNKEIENDYRESFHPKKNNSISNPPYIQVFQSKMEFIPHLSILDLLFNEGTNTKNYLMQL